MSDDHPRSRPFETVAVWTGIAVFCLGVWGVILWSVLQLIHWS